LPLAPAEIKYQSRVDMLEAKREELRRRRININSIIDELTQVVPTSRAYDLAARNEIKKTVASLNDELAEINREDHELGLKILRAWKKRDEECVYESGSSLWVKRVTG
jgi:prefoldin subunit 5